MKSALTSTLKLWEKDVGDFLKSNGSNSIKVRKMF